MNRARQYRKTTTLYLLERCLQKDYLVLSLSFEAADEYFQSLESLAEGLVMDIGECLRAQNVSEEIICNVEQSIVRKSFRCAHLERRLRLYVAHVRRK